MWRKTSVTLLLLMYVRDSLSQLDVCGQAPLNPRIVGGVDAHEGAWPWMVSLHNSGGFFCGGSLINNEWVLTAVHCVICETTSSMFVYLGRWKQQANNPHEIRSTIKDIILHPSYNIKTYDNDIALLKLSTAVTFNNYIKPICLADKKSKFLPGISSWVIGWGHIGVRGIGGVRGRTTVSVPLPSPGTLREVEVQVFKNKDCKNLCRGPITSNMICVGTAQGGQGHWVGDSGGPMMSKCSVWIQSGVASHSYGCAQANRPGVFTRVSEYKQWIIDNVGPNLPGFVVYGQSCSSGSQGNKLLCCIG